jgi:hypothetical protein
MFDNDQKKSTAKRQVLRRRTYVMIGHHQQALRVSPVRQIAVLSTVVKEMTMNQRSDLMSEPIGCRLALSIGASVSWEIRRGFSFCQI